MTRAHRIVSLPAMERARAELTARERAHLAAVLRDIGDGAEGEAQRSWEQRKAPMAAYWRALGVYARHIARALERGGRDGQTNAATVEGDGPLPQAREHPQAQELEAAPALGR